MSLMKLWKVIVVGAACAMTAYLATLYLPLDKETLDAAGRVLLAVAMLLVLVFGMRRRERATQRSAVGALDARASKSDTTFSEVAANEEAVRSLTELADYLKAPEKYARYGARMPRGVLLYGPPGTGKTLLARALAGEAGVPFYALSGSDFVEMYVGVGAGRVRELFQKARKAGRCVVFIDEIDSMGKRREGMSSDERDQTLNALLSEMSGFSPNDGVIVLAATNRLDVLDPALLRPGRFDRQIEVALPDRAQRLKILRLHSREKPLSPSVDLERLSLDTALFSGASLESLLNEAAISAAQRDAEEIGMSDVERAFISVVAGQDRECAAPSQAERLLVALHEAGHALATRLIMPDHHIMRVSILPTTRGAAGYSLSIPPERGLMSRAALSAQIKVLLAGRAAEQLIAGDEEITSGASGDLSRAAELAAAMALDLGMAGDPAVALRALGRACGGNGKDGMELCQGVLGDAYRAVYELLSANAEKLMALMQALLDHDTLNGDQVDAAVMV